MLILIPIILPIFIIAGVGYGWTRLGLGFDTGFVTRLVTYVGTPCLIFSAMTDNGLTLEGFRIMAIAALAAMVAFAAVGAVALKVAKMPVRPFLPSLMLPNTGNMGLPISLFAFGETGLALAIAFSTIITVGHFTIGVSLAAGRASGRELLFSPTLYALAAALAFMASGTAPPQWLTNTIGLLAGLTIPLMLISLGVSLGRMRVSNVRRGLFLGIVRVGGGFVVGVALAALLGLDREAAGILVIQCAMPVAVLNYLFAARYDGPAEEVAGTVVFSTLLSFVTLPFLLAYLL